MQASYHSPLEGESQKPSRQAKADAVGGGRRRRQAAANCPFRFISRTLSRKIAPPSPFKEEISMKDKTDQTLPLEAAKVEFLEQMVQAHGLSDIGKAVRCLIDYARENPDRQAVIFEEVRCVDC